jgi:SAM-dependent methyltransferase
MLNPMATEELVRLLASRYSGDAEAYRELWAPELLPLARRLLESVDLSGAGRILDLGAGVGALYPDERAASPEATIVLADRAEGMIRLAASETPRGVLDARDLPFAYDSFDAVMMTFVLFHVPQPLRVLKGIRRLLVPGGRLGLATWGEQRWRAALNAWAEELDEHGAEEDVTIANHDLMDNETKVRGLLESAHLTVDSIETVRSEHPVTLEEFIRLRTRIGPSARRLNSLDPVTREACLQRAIARIKDMDPREFVDDVDAILAVARRVDRVPR